MVVTVLSLGAVELVWYSLSLLSVLSNVFQIDGQVWLFYTLCISNWVSCVVPSCVRICDQTYVLKLFSSRSHPDTSVAEVTWFAGCLMIL